MVAVAEERMLPMQGEKQDLQEAVLRTLRSNENFPPVMAGTWGMADAVGGSGT